MIKQYPSYIMRNPLIWIIVWFSFGINPIINETHAETIKFNRDIRPILADNCWSCHGPDKGNRKAKLRLDISDHSKGGVIVPGKVSESELIDRILSGDSDEVMPPIDHRKKLTKKEKETLVQWIKEGAEWEDHWAWIKPTRKNNLDSKNAIDTILKECLSLWEAYRLTSPTGQRCVRTVSLRVLIM